MQIDSTMLSLLVSRNIPTIVILALDELRDWQGVIIEAINLAYMLGSICIHVNTSGYSHRDDRENKTTQLNRLLTDILEKHSFSSNKLTHTESDPDYDGKFFVIRIQYHTTDQSKTIAAPPPVVETDLEPALVRADPTDNDLEALKQHGGMDSNVLQLSVRTYNALLAVFNLDPLLQTIAGTQETTLLKSKGIGCTAVREIKRELARFDLRLGMYIPENMTKWHAWKARHPTKHHAPSSDARYRPSPLVCLFFLSGEIETTSVSIRVDIFAIDR